MPYFWVESTACDRIPENAVWCCKDKDESDIYLGKCKVESSLLPVKIVPRRQEAYAAYNGKEIPVMNFKILINSNNEYTVWVRSSKNVQIPLHAIECGHDKNNVKLLIGRAFYKGYCIPGYVNATTKVIHFPFGGKEYKCDEYEVLINNVN